MARIAFMASETAVAQAALRALSARHGSVAPHAADVIVALGKRVEPARPPGAPRVDSLWRG